MTDYKPKVGERARLLSSPDDADQDCVGKIGVLVERPRCWEDDLGIDPNDPGNACAFLPHGEAEVIGIHRDAVWEPVAAQPEPDPCTPIPVAVPRCSHCEDDGTEHEDQGTGNGAQCPKPATHRSCVPYADSPHCDEHKCRCAKPIAQPEPPASDPEPVRGTVAIPGQPRKVLASFPVVIEPPASDPIAVLRAFFSAHFALNSFPVIVAALAALERDRAAHAAEIEEWRQREDDAIAREDVAQRNLERCRAAHAAEVERLRGELAEAQRKAEMHWNAYCGATARHRSAQERERVAHEHRAVAEAELAKARAQMLAFTDQGDEGQTLEELLDAVELEANCEHEQWTAAEARAERPMPTRADLIFALIDVPRAPALNHGKNWRTVLDGDWPVYADAVLALFGDEPKGPAGD